MENEPLRTELIVPSPEWPCVGGVSACPGQPLTVKYHFLQQPSLLTICHLHFSLFKPGINQGPLLLCNPIKRELNASQKLDPSAQLRVKHLYHVRYEIGLLYPLQTHLFS